MQIFLIRHTRVGVQPGMCYGVSDVPLAEQWREDVARVIEKLGVERVSHDNLFSSPLTRCRQLSDTLSGAASFDERLKEMNFGEWEGRLWSDIPRSEIDAWAGDLENTVAPGGESLGMVYKRSAAFLEELRAKPNLEHAFVVTHGGVIRCMLAYTLGLSIRYGNRVEIDYGSVSTIRLSERISKVECMNV